METVVLEQHSGMRIRFHSIKPLYTDWRMGQALSAILAYWMADCWSIVWNVLYGNNESLRDWQGCSEQLRVDTARSGMEWRLEPWW